MAEFPTARGRSLVQTRGEPATAARCVLDLARAAGAGDERAMAELYERRFALVFEAARRAANRDEQFCLDVVQECFLRVLRAGPALARLRDADHVDRWLARVAQSSALDRLRIERRRMRRERLAAKPERSRELDDRIDRLDADLSRLSAEERQLLHLRSSGLTLDGIAELIGTTIGTVHGRLRRLGARLRATHKEARHER